MSPICFTDNSPTQIHTIHHMKTQHKIHTTHTVTLTHGGKKEKCGDIWGHSLFKNPIAHGTKDNLYLLVQPLGSLNLCPDGSSWNSICKRMWRVQNDGLCLWGDPQFIQALKVINIGTSILFFSSLFLSFHTLWEMGMWLEMRAVSITMKLTHDFFPGQPNIVNVICPKCQKMLPNEADLQGRKAWSRVQIECYLKKLPSEASPWSINV